MPYINFDNFDEYKEEILNFLKTYGYPQATIVKDDALKRFVLDLRTSKTVNYADLQREMFYNGIVIRDEDLNITNTLTITTTEEGLGQEAAASSAAGEIDEGGMRFGASASSANASFSRDADGTVTFNFLGDAGEIDSHLSGGHHPLEDHADEDEPRTGNTTCLRAIWKCFASLFLWHARPTDDSGSSNNSSTEDHLVTSPYSGTDYVVPDPVLAGYWEIAHS